MNVQSALWMLMAWCFSTRTSVATVLTTHPCVSRCLGDKGVNLELIVLTDFMITSREMFSCECQRTNCWQVKIGSVNDLVHPGTKTLPEPMLAQISIAIWRDNLLKHIKFLLALSWLTPHVIEFITEYVHINEMGKHYISMNIAHKNTCMQINTKSCLYKKSEVH